MEFQFDTVEQYDALWGSVHDSILYWKKVRQDAQGKICMQCDGTQTHYDEKYCIDMIVMNAQLLKTIEDSPHPEWNGSSYEMSSPPEFNSTIIIKSLRMDSGVDTED